jgi:hypothetical protein
MTDVDLWQDAKGAVRVLLETYGAEVGDPVRTALADAFSEIEAARSIVSERENAPKEPFPTPERMFSDLHIALYGDEPRPSDEPLADRWMVLTGGVVANRQMAEQIHASRPLSGVVMPDE